MTLLPNSSRNVLACFTNSEKTLLTNIEILKSCGIHTDQIYSMMYFEPRLFFTSPENMRSCVSNCDQMSVQRSSRAFIYVVRTVCHRLNEALELKLKSFKDLGFSQDDILRVFRTAPGESAVSTQKIKEVVEVLLESGKYDMSSIINNSESLTRNTGKRFKPRLEVLKSLEEGSIINKWPSLSTLCAITNEKFFQKFVAPNINEVGKILRQRLISLKNRHGKWLESQLEVICMVEWELPVGSVPGSPS